MSIFKNACPHFLIRLLHVILIGFLPSVVLAHRVNIFAEVDAGVVNINCYYSKGEKVHDGKIKILEARNGSLIYKGTTDKNGFLSFTIPEIVVKDNSDIKIILDAGMGHRAEWNVSYKEILESLENLKGNPSLSLWQKRNSNEVKNENAAERYGIQLSRIVLGLIMIFIVFTFAYFLTKKKRGEAS